MNLGPMELIVMMLVAVLPLLAIAALVLWLNRRKNAAYGQTSEAVQESQRLQELEQRVAELEAERRA